MIGPLLRRVCLRHGRTAALLCAVKVARVSVGAHCPTVSMETLERRLLRRNPADSLTVALRVCNATTSREFVAGMALLALTKAAVQDDDDAAAAALWVGGLLLDLGLGSREDARRRCSDFLVRLSAVDDAVAVGRVIGEFNAEVVSSSHGERG